MIKRTQDVAVDLKLDQFFGAFGSLSDKMLGLLIRPPPFRQMFEGGRVLS